MFKPRSRFAAKDLRTVFKRARESAGENTFNRNRHNREHRERILVYSSKKTLTTTAGTEFYSPYSGLLQWIRVSCGTAPSGAALKVDVLVDGVTVFDGTNFAEVPDGATYGYRIRPDTVSILGTDAPGNDPTPIRVQINTVSSAGGPMLVYFGIRMK